MVVRHFLVILLLVGIVPLSAAQGPAPETLTGEIVNIGVVAEETFAELEVGDQVQLEVIVTDYSRDSSGGLVGQEGFAATQHLTTFQLIPPPPIGWTVFPPSATQTVGGQVVETFLQASINNQVKQSSYSFTLNSSTPMPDGSTLHTEVGFAFLTKGPSSFNVLPGSPLQMSPGEITRQGFKVTNGGLLPRQFIVELEENVCGMTIAMDQIVVVGPKQTETFYLTLRGPTDKVYYAAELCGIKLRISDFDESNNFRLVSMNPQVSGVYVKTEWQINAVIVTALAAILILFVLRRKAAIEEELLGKPQRPWTIPVERVYLEHLEARDPRAAYVVRHFLMEEEYKSSLLWYKSFKQATRGERAKETLVVRQERAYNRFKKGWGRRIAAPINKADRFEASLQKKLDRQAKGDVRGQRRKWKKTVAKLEAAHQAQFGKAMGRWEKAAKKAEKKGQPVPPRPTQTAPDLPPEPSMGRTLLADHKWQSKADKLRRKMVRKQGNLEVKFEKKDARMLHKVRRKVHRIAKKIDDPEFVEEHPLMQDLPGPSASD